MNAHELLDALHVAGIAVWVEQGRLGIYPPSRLTPELKQALREQGKELARIIEQEYICWHCESHHVRFDVPLQRYVCEACRRVLQEPLSPFPPLHELLWQAGSVYGFPALKLAPHITLKAGRESWLTFCTSPFTKHHTRLLVLAYRKLVNPAQADEIEPEPNHKPHHTTEVNHMKLVWQDSEPLPTGEYLVRVASITEKEGKYSLQLQWMFRVLEPGYEGRELIAYTNATNSTTAKLAQWARALGCEVVPGEEFDTDELVGRKAIAVVVVKPSQQGNRYNHVENLLPVRQKKPVAVSAKAESEAEERDYFSEEEED
ncbi:MAG: DUF669 domain-containing protein [Firmicutes bacterium]|nr:DUF669 domain-containing protein [Bacillota bacterium]